MFYRGRKVEGASASSFESLGNGMGKDNWHTYHYGERYDGSALSGERLGGGYSKDSWTVYYRGRKVDGASAMPFESLGNWMPGRYFTGALR